MGQQIDRAEQRLQRQSREALDRYHRQLAAYGASLSALSPLATLSRGYALALDAQGTLVTKASQVETGQKLTVRLAQGSLLCQVEQKEEV